MKFHLSSVLALILLFSPSVSYGIDDIIVLRRNVVGNKIVLNTRELNRKNATYVVKYQFDLMGGSLNVPDGCTLVFKNRGAISNGSIQFSNTTLVNERFKNIERAGGTLANCSFEAWRYGFKDDTEMFRFLFSQVRSGFSLVLENRTYSVNSIKDVKRVIYDSSFALFNGISGIRIIGNNARIIDSADTKSIGDYLFSFLKFQSCSDVEISKVTYSWLGQPVLDPKVKGIIFIRTIDECCNFNLQFSVENVGRGLYSGMWAYTGHPGRGLCDSKIDARSYNAGYPIAIEKGDRLSIRNCFNTAHRGTYLAGVTNSTVYVEAVDAFSTAVNLLLTDTADADGCYFCDNIDATVKDVGSGPLMKKPVIMCQCDIYPQSYSQFKGRKKYDIKDIRVHVFSPKDSNTSYECFMCTDLSKIGDRINVTVDGIMEDKGSNSRLFRISRLASGHYTFNGVRSHMNYIIGNDAIPANTKISVNDCNNVIFYETPQSQPTDAVVEFNNCTFSKYKKTAGSGYYPKVVVKKDGQIAR